MSKSSNRYEGIDPYTVQQVRYHARQMLRHRAMSGMEIEDIEQELMLDYLSRIQSFDPEKACRKTFVDRILRHKCASMIAKATAEKRNRGVGGISLEAFLEDGDREDIPESQGLWGAHAQPQKIVEMAIDLAEAIRALPPMAQTYCLLLMQDPSIRTLCRTQNRHPSTIYQSIGRIRQEFAERDLQKYLH